MTMNFIPEKGDVYYFATNRRVYSFQWDEDSADIDLARSMGVFPPTPYGKKLVKLQHALMVETSMFWEWLDDYVL